MHLSKHYRGCCCIFRLILQLDVTLSASWHVFLVFIFIWLNISFIYFISFIFHLFITFIWLKDSSNRIEILYHNWDRIGFGLDNFGTDRILNIGQLSDYKRPIRFDARLAPSLSFIIISIHYSVHYMTYHVGGARKRDLSTSENLGSKLNRKCKTCFDCFPFCIIYYNGTHVIYTVLDQYI
jgi:hypothetical protein